MDKESCPPLSQKQKQDITDIFNKIFKQPLNRLSHIMRNDLILNGIEVSNIQTELKTKIEQFYEQLFIYFCIFPHPKSSLDLINEEDHIIKNTDNHNVKESKFCLYKLFVFCLSFKNIQKKQLRCESLLHLFE